MSTETLESTKEAFGWTWLHNSKKWHYFVEGRSLCNGFMLFKHPSEGYQHGNNTSPDNCAACRKKLEKREQS
jgi:hypothetical protein